MTSRYAGLARFYQARARHSWQGGARYEEQQKLDSYAPANTYRNGAGFEFPGIRAVRLCTSISRKPFGGFGSVGWGSSRTADAASMAEIGFTQISFFIGSR